MKYTLIPTNANPAIQIPPELLLSFLAGISKEKKNEPDESLGVHPYHRFITFTDLYLSLVCAHHGRHAQARSKKRRALIPTPTESRRGQKSPKRDQESQDRTKCGHSADYRDSNPRMKDEVAMLFDHRNRVCWHRRIPLSRMLVPTSMGLSGMTSDSKTGSCVGGFLGVVTLTKIRFGGKYSDFVL